MNNLAFIGRNGLGKGLSDLLSAFNKLRDIPITLHVFSDSIDIKPSNVIWHGWLDRDEIWRIDFDYVCLPINAPETYCFAMHEAVKNQKGLIVNGENESLTSQILSGAKIYNGLEDLRRIIIALAQDKRKEVELVTLKRKRSIWERI